MKNIPELRIVKPGTQIEDVMRSIIASKDDEDGFLMMNIDELIHKFDDWSVHLPQIRPFYAVKCNDSSPILKVLAYLGCGFDCASKEEIRTVLKQGVSAKNIIYANPAKPKSHLLFAKDVGVTLMTFDNVKELEKIKRYYPETRVVLRIRADALDASIPLGSKFGCEPDQAGEVIVEAARLGLNLVGFSFHVGTGCKEPEAYPRAIKIAISLLPVANKYGYNITILDIGGGFPGDSPSDFCKVSRLINKALEEERDKIRNVTLIAEPGRYFVSTAYKFATTIVGIRNVPSKTIYTVNDSIYGLFNCVWTEHIFKIPKQLYNSKDYELKSSAVWGNTPSVYDRIVDDCLLPELKIGEWVIFEDMGAYSVCLYTKFQSPTKPRIFYMVTDTTWRNISKELREI